MGHWINGVVALAVIIPDSVARNREFRDLAQCSAQLCKMTVACKLVVSAIRHASTHAARSPTPERSDPMLISSVKDLEGDPYVTGGIEKSF